MQDQSVSTSYTSGVDIDCPSCGAVLKYSAELKKLSCNHCGYVEDHDTSNDKVVELELQPALEKLKSYEPTKVDRKVYDCENCGAKTLLEQDKVQVTCGFCGSSNIIEKAYEKRFVEPAGIIPFYISRKEATTRFKKWIRQGIFHPNKLKKLANIDNFHGVYIPFWTFDAQVQAQWHGEAGHFYYETVRTRVNGKMVNRQVQKIRWVRRSGDLQHFFDDITVLASGGLTQQEIEGVLPYRLSEVVNFDARLMLGWEAEVYQIELDRGYQEGDAIMNSHLRQMCSAQLGGDTQRGLHVRSQKWGHTFKHLILPLWICTYKYNGKIYRFQINGQTGKVSGQKPLSWIKITLAVLLFLAIVAGIYYLREMQQ